jgi:hypothetical protein
MFQDLVQEVCRRQWNYNDGNSIYGVYITIENDQLIVRSKTTHKIVDFFDNHIEHIYVDESGVLLNFDDKDIELQYLSNESNKIL